MILVIPSFEIYNGKCTSVIQGNVESQSLYYDFAEDVISFCSLLRRENSKSIHIIDRNSFEGQDNNFELIVKAASTLDIAFQLTADFQNVDQCRELLDKGIYRLVINDLIFDDPDGVRQLIKDYTTSNIAVSCHSDQGKILASDKTIDVAEFCETVKEIGANRIVYSNEIWHDQAEPDYSEIVDIFDKYKLRFTLNDSIRTSKQLIDLNNYKRNGIDSVIIGQALFDNVFPCQNIWRDIECKLEG